MNPSETQLDKVADPIHAEVIRLPTAASMADGLYEYLRAEILMGRLRPGERLVEAQVAKRASVSRTPVREALHRLEVDGFVMTRGRTVTVVEFSLSELTELCTAREGLEGFAARLAATAASDMELEVLEGFLELNHKAVEDGDLADQVRLNHLFHEALWRAAHNEYLRRHLETLRGLIERGRPTTLQIPGRPEESLQEHTAIVEALTSRDAPAAEVATKLHFRRAMALRLLTQRHLGPTVEDHSGAVAEAEAGRESNETFVRTSNGSGRP